MHSQYYVYVMIVLSQVLYIKYSQYCVYVMIVHTQVSTVCTLWLYLRKCYEYSEYYASGRDEGDCIA